MKLLPTLLCWLALAASALAANVTFYVGPSGQTLYVRLNESGTYVARALTEGTSGGEGTYYATEAQLVSAGLDTVSGGSGFDFTVRVGSPSTSATDPIVAFGALRWTGSAVKTDADDFATILTYLGEIGDAVSDLASTIGTPAGDSIADDIANLEGGGGTAVSPFISDDKHAWHFTRRDQMTSPEILVETKSVAIIKSMDFSEVLPAGSSIGTVLSVTIADIADSVEPTITTVTLSPSKRKVDVVIDASAASSATYTFAFKVRSPDSQEYTRYGRLTLQ